LKKVLQHLKQVFILVLSLILSLPGLAYAEPAVNALPTGGQVVSGDASIATSGATLNVNQTSQRAIVNWDSFNVAVHLHSIEFQVAHLHKFTAR